MARRYWPGQDPVGQRAKKRGATSGSPWLISWATIMEGRFQLTERVGVAIGVDNVFDEYPDFVPEALNSNGVLGFPYYSPFGFNGRYAYARVSLNW